MVPLPPFDSGNLGENEEPYALPLTPPAILDSQNDKGEEIDPIAVPTAPPTESNSHDDAQKPGDSEDELESYHKHDH